MKFGYDWSSGPKGDVMVLRKTDSDLVAIFHIFTIFSTAFAPCLSYMPRFIYPSEGIILFFVW